MANEMRYYPYGETRSGTMDTDRRYTGQRWEAGIGLYDYNARYYDPTLGQMTSVQVGSNLTTNYTYAAQDLRLGQIQIGSLRNFTYNYDAVGNVLQMHAYQSRPFSDDFNTQNTSAWTWSGYQTVPYTDGGEKVVRTVASQTWNATFYRTSTLNDGKGVQLRFKVAQTNNKAIFALVSEDGTYRRFGAMVKDGKLQVQYNDGGGWVWPADLITNLQTNTWYVVRLTVDDNDGFTVEAYQESNPAVRGSYTRQMTTGKTWRFQHWVYDGTAYVDAYREYVDVQWGAFTYDHLDRLTSAVMTGNGSDTYERSYGYDLMGNLQSRSTDSGSWNYTYPSSGARPHAVTSVSKPGTHWSFGYDANGNMTSRTVDAGVFTLEYNAENKLKTYKQGSTTLASYTYDGDGNLAKRVAGSTTTYYAGAHYEKENTTVRKYYYLGGQRVAMREGSTVRYLHGDHLGSASLATNTSGGKVSEMRYYPYGETRSGTMDTDRRYTGQRWEAGIGLYDYNARHYDPALGRFVQADTVVPSMADPQDLNRYSYVRGNPLKYIDPSGHWYEDPITGALLPGDSPPSDLEVGVSCDWVNRSLDTRFSQFVQVEHIRGPALRSGGGFEWRVRFRLPQAADNDGWIIQRIHYKKTITNEEGAVLLNREDIYYEAWPVKKGRKTVTTRYTRGWPWQRYNDEYTGLNWPSTTSGDHNVEGTVRFYEGDLPKHFKEGQVSNAPGLYASSAPPYYWDGCGTVHSIKVNWSGGSATADLQWGNFTRKYVAK